jgi:hypothetical protein
MKNTFLSLCLLLSTFVFADETHKYSIEFKLCELVYLKDKNMSIKDEPIKVSLTTHSEVVQLYKSDTKTYGIRFEVFESKVSDEPEYYLRVAYYYKMNSEWVLIFATDPHEVPMQDAVGPMKADCADSFVYGKEFSVKFSLRLSFG